MQRSQWHCSGGTTHRQRRLRGRPREPRARRVAERTRGARALRVVGEALQDQVPRAVCHLAVDVGAHAQLAEAHGAHEAVVGQDGAGLVGRGVGEDGVRERPLRPLPEPQRRVHVRKLHALEALRGAEQRQVGARVRLRHERALHHGRAHGAGHPVRSLHVAPQCQLRAKQHQEHHQEDGLAHQLRLALRHYLRRCLLPSRIKGRCAHLAIAIAPAPPAAVGALRPPQSKCRSAIRIK